MNATCATRINQRLPSLFAAAVLLLTAAAEAADGPPYATDMPATERIGRAVVDVIEELRGQGHRIVYSSRLVSPDLLVTLEPASSAPLEALSEILAAHELMLAADGETYLVVRRPGVRTIGPGLSRARPASRAAAPEAIETIGVSASRYEIARDIATSQFPISRQTIRNMPDVGEDPIRAAHRLPGAAASGASARAHFRGGDQSEVGIILNGQRLFDPFHIRDYQNVFSAIDARAIEGVEVFTGGFPVRFGDRMSGLVVMDSIDADKPRHTEIGLSVFNTSFLSVGNGPGRQWLLSARRGNLDLVIDPRYGRPSYYDVFSELAFDVGLRSSLSVNALYADDTVTVVLETEPLEREEARSMTRNAQLWAALDTQWTSDLSSRTTLSYADYRNRRTGTINDPQKLVAVVNDDRDVRETAFRQDWLFKIGDDHLVQWGLGVRRSRADYDYAGSASYSGLQALYRDQPGARTRTLRASPSGGSYALYFADRLKLSKSTIVEWGLRWDDQTYTGIESDAQLSPRATLLYRWRKDTDLRVSWGRYHQSQGIEELQIEDGVSRFWPAQRADHFIASAEHRVSDRLMLRVEAFLKDMRDVRPRFENLFDPLALIPELQADRVRLDPASARSRGVEVSLDGEEGGWSWWSSYTWSKATDLIDGRNELRSWDQRHAVQGGISWSGDGWNVALAAAAHTGWPTSELALVEDGVDADGEPILVAVPGARNAHRHGTFSSVDFRVSRKFDVRRGSLSVFLEVSNAANRRNACCRDWDIEEDEDGNSMLESSPDFWLPLLPAIGILWEF